MMCWFLTDIFIDDINTLYYLVVSQFVKGFCAVSVYLSVTPDNILENDWPTVHLHSWAKPGDRLYLYEDVLTLRRFWCGCSRKWSLGPGLTRWGRHLNRANVLNVSPRKVASLLGALVAPEEPAQALRLLLPALLVALHGRQWRLADCQDVFGLQVQVLFLVLGKCVESTVLKALCRHFVGETKIKMATK